MLEIRYAALLKIFAYYAQIYAQYFIPQFPFFTAK